jgi:hypothetical protein
MELDDRTKLEEGIQQAAIDFGIHRDWAGNFIVRKGANRWFIDIIAPPRLADGRDHVICATGDQKLLMKMLQLITVASLMSTMRCITFCTSRILPGHA